MVIDNTGRIKRLIAGCGKDEFYMLQIIHRVKDGHTKYEPQDQKSTEQVIKTYYVSSPEYLDRKIEEIKDLCQMFNARAMFNLNRKSWKQVGLKQLELTAQALGKEGKEEKWWKTIKSSLPVVRPVPVMATRPGSWTSIPKTRMNLTTLLILSINVRLLWKTKSLLSFLRSMVII